MMRLRTLALVGIVLALGAGGTPARAQTPATVRSQAPVAAAACGPTEGKLALILPGGGAKGFAHLGVLRMLDSLGIVPDLVVGTSAGAIIGALYASGLEVDEIEREVKGLGLDTLVGRYRATTPPSLGTRRAILVWEAGSSGLVLNTGVVREAPLNTLVSALYARGNLIAAGDFDRLPIPFRAVAADLSTREQVILGTGDLAQAVRASGAIPIVFRSVLVDGRTLVDGGIVDNVPIGAARALGATRIIVSGLRDTSRFDVRDDDPVTIAGQLLNFVFEQPVPPLTPGDVWVSADVSGVNQLDFSLANIDRVLAAGTRGAVALRDAPCLPRGRVRPRGQLPPIATDVVDPRTEVELGDVIWRTLGDVGGRIPDVPRLQARIRSLSQVDRYRAIWLYPQRTTGDSVLFAARGRAASNEQLLVGAAFDRELGPRVWVGRVQRVARRNAEVTGVVALGQLQQEASLTLRRSYDVLGSPWSPVLGATLTRTRVRDIRGGAEFPEVQTADGLAEFGIERRITRRVSVALTAFARQWDEPVFAGTPAALGARLRLQSAASSSDVPRGVVVFEGTPRYWRSVAELHRTRETRGFTVESVVSAVVGEHLPLQHSAFLGGSDVGFPGFKIQEMRGAQAAMAALHVGRAVYGPLRVQGMVAGGALQRSTYGVFRRASGYFGVRGGVGVVTALGPLAVEYGVNDRGRGNLFLRFGDWF
ncbi:MAG: patatin-like phospholipase family protein [Gemmatimonadota bacterium]|nr:patatin-like phospholipase family protein [Gemmatimonadota bacterium]